MAFLQVRLSPSRRVGFRELETLRLRVGVNPRANRAQKVKPKKDKPGFLWLLF